jgi:hypothetical protein
VGAESDVKLLDAFGNSVWRAATPILVGAASLPPVESLSEFPGSLRLGAVSEVAVMFIAVFVVNNTRTLYIIETVRLACAVWDSHRRVARGRMIQ